MAKIVIKDLEKLEELDMKAMSRTYGGKYRLPGNHGLITTASADSLVVPVTF
jgi:hypothetical protein